MTLRKTSMALLISCTFFSVQMTHESAASSPDAVGIFQMEMDDGGDNPSLFSPSSPLSPAPALTQTHPTQENAPHPWTKSQQDALKLFCEQTVNSTLFRGYRSCILSGLKDPSSICERWRNGEAFIQSIRLVFCLQNTDKDAVRALLDATGVIP